MERDRTGMLLRSYRGKKRRAIHLITIQSSAARMIANAIGQLLQWSRRNVQREDGTCAARLLHSEDERATLLTEPPRLDGGCPRRFDLGWVDGDHVADGVLKQWGWEGNYGHP